MKPLSPGYDSNDQGADAAIAERARITDDMKRQNIAVPSNASVQKPGELEMPKASHYIMPVEPTRSIRGHREVCRRATFGQQELIDILSARHR
jgi:hypothetical protein